jgi:hypothetical protein
MLIDDTGGIGWMPGFGMDVVHHRFPLPLASEMNPLNAILCKQRRSPELAACAVNT